MTSKISFFKLMQEDIKRKIWLVVLAVLVFFISFPVAAMVWLDNIGRRSSYLTAERVQELAKDAFLTLFGYANIWMIVITVVGAGLCGIFSFSYLYKKKKVDFYHSIPVRREKLFFVSYLNGLLIYLVPYLVMILICVFIGSRYFTIDSMVWSVVRREFGVQVLFYLLLYHTTILTSVLAGNMFGCLFLNGIAEFYVIFVYGIYIAYCNGYFYTYTSLSENFYESAAGLSPIMAFFKGIERLIGADSRYNLRLRAGEVSIKLYLMQCFLVAVLLLGIAVYLYKIRSSEMAGKAIAFQKIQPVIRILIVIPSAMAGGLIFDSLTNSEIGWMVFGMILVAVLVHGAVEVLYQSDIRGMFSYKIQLAGTIVAAVAIALAFRNDWFGYDTYIPKIEKMESVAINIDGIGSGGWYTIEDPIRGSYNISSSTYIMEEMKLNGDLLPVVQELIRLGVQTSEAETRELSEASDRWVSFRVKVRLKGGKDVFRFYLVSLNQAYDLLDQIFCSQEFKEKVYAYLLQHRSEAEVVIGGKTQRQGLSKKESAEFLEIYQKELMALTLDDLRDNPVIGKVQYNISRLRDGEVLGLYPVMTESLAYLEKIGILENDLFLAQPKAEDVEALQIGEYYEEVDSDGMHYSNYQKVEITEREQIEEICEKLYFYNEYNNDLFWEKDYDYDIDVILKPEVAGQYSEIEERKWTVLYKKGDEETASLVEEMMRTGRVIEESGGK